jgi:transcriptional regulator of acetoin/glycerol metabolism
MQATLDQIRKDSALSMLRDANWNVTHAAERAGIDRGTLYRWLKRWGIDPDRERRKAERGTLKQAKVSRG